MNWFMGNMNSSLLPNFPPFASFWITLEDNTRFRCMYSSILNPEKRDVKRYLSITFQYNPKGFRRNQRRANESQEEERANANRLPVCRKVRNSEEFRNKFPFFNKSGKNISYSPLNLNVTAVQIRLAILRTSSGSRSKEPQTVSTTMPQNLLKFCKKLVSLNNPESSFHNQTGISTIHWNSDLPRYW